MEQGAANCAHRVGGWQWHKASVEVNTVTRATDMNIRREEMILGLKITELIFPIGLGARRPVRIA